MDAYNYLKDEILKVNQDVLTLISNARYGGNQFR